MATPRSQQIGIWVIAVTLTIGTLGSFLAMILGSQNQATDQARLKKMDSEYRIKVSTQTKALSDKYYGEFSQYATIPTTFNAADVKELVKTDLKIGDGAEIKSGTPYSAYYIGWNPKGVIFDQSIKNGALIAPILGGEFITGWNEGIIGMRFGGIRELTIPSDKAYGSTASSADIPANTPLKFIIMIIPKVTDVPMPAELLEYYQSQSAGA